MLLHRGCITRTVPRIVVRLARYCPVSQQECPKTRRPLQHLRNCSCRPSFHSMNDLHHSSTLHCSICVDIICMWFHITTVHHQDEAFHDNMCNVPDRTSRSLEHSDSDPIYQNHGILHVFHTIMQTPRTSFRNYLERFALLLVRAMC